MKFIFWLIAHHKESTFARKPLALNYQILTSNFIFQQIYNAHILTNHYTCNIIRRWLSEKGKANFADNLTSD